MKNFAFPVPFLKIPLVAVGLVLAAGCTSVKLDEAGEYQAVNQAGKFRMLVNADAAQTLVATREVMQEMRLAEVQTTVRRFEAEVLAKTDLGEPVRIHIREVNSRQSELQIRVKWVGHQDYSRRLWEQIDAKVGAAP